MIGLREMSRADLAMVLDWAAEEGWNPGLDDCAAFLSADPQGFFVAEQQGMPVASISVVNYGDDFAFLGLYICRPEYRGRGIAHALWQHAMAHAGDRTVGLDGVPDQQANYAKSGFVHAGATTRYAGAVEGATHARIREAREADIPALVELETHASGWRKDRFLSAWFRRTPHRITFVHSGQDGEISGLATVRACRFGAKVGPFVAANDDIAQALLQQSASAFGEHLIVDVPNTAGGLADLCNAWGLLPGFHTARMYRGPFDPAHPGVYAVSTLELG